MPGEIRIVRRNRLAAWEILESKLVDPAIGITPEQAALFDSI
jgi:hypothetical protein